MNYRRVLLQVKNECGQKQRFKLLRKISERCCVSEIKILLFYYFHVIVYSVPINVLRYEVCLFIQIKKKKKSSLVQEKKKEKKKEAAQSPS